MIRLIRELVRPYRVSLLIMLLAMLVETAMSLATPWPLKVIIDNVVGHHKMSPWLADIFRPGWMASINCTSRVWLLSLTS
jgi:subfamily B ATP-binding cassette protein MsbA